MKHIWTPMILILSIGILFTTLGVLAKTPSEALIPQTEVDQSAYIPFFLEGLLDGNSMPDFTAEDLEGNLVSSQQLEGKTVIIKFWSPECQYCRSELPQVIKFYEETQDHYVFLTVVSDMPAAQLRTFAHEQALPFPILIDEDSSIKDAFKVKVIPYTYYIGTNGRVEKSVVGAETCSSNSSECSIEISETSN